MWIVNDFRYSPDSDSCNDWVRAFGPFHTEEAAVDFMNGRIIGYDQVLEVHKLESPE